MDAPAPPRVGLRVTGRPASLARGAVLVTPAITLLNVAGYVLAVAGAHALTTSGYGELSALLGVLVVASVPALAVQAVAARSVARRPVGEQPGPRERALLLRASVASVVVALATAVAAPVLAAFLHTGATGLLLLAAQLAPLVVLSAAAGVLQGAERFAALATVIAVQALGKGVGVLPLLAGGGATAVMAALAAGLLLAAALAVALVGRGLRGAAPKGLPGVREAAGAAGALVAVLALANLDLLLARHLLPARESGRYGAGTVLAKAAFWLPQAIVLVAFPRLSDCESGQTVLRRAVLVVTGLGVLEVVGCTLLAAPVLRVTFGSDYASVATIAPLWVVQGTALALVQLLLYRAIALRDPVPARVVGAAVGLEALVLLVVRPTSPAPVISVAAFTAVILTVVLLAQSRRARPVATSGRPAVGGARTGVPASGPPPAL